MTLGLVCFYQFDSTRFGELGASWPSRIVLETSRCVLSSNQAGKFRFLCAECTYMAKEVLSKVLVATLVIPGWSTLACKNVPACTNAFLFRVLDDCF